MIAVYFVVCVKIWANSISFVLFLLFLSLFVGSLELRPGLFYEFIVSLSARLSLLQWYIHRLFVALTLRTTTHSRPTQDLIVLRAQYVPS